MSRIFDISQTIRPGIPVWPGDSAFTLERTWSIEPGCPVNVSAMTMSTHTGSHADSRLHFREDGVDCAATALDAYIGPATLIDLSATVKSGSLVEPHHLEAVLPVKVERVLIKLFKSFPHDGWDSDFPAMSPDAIRLLAARGCKLIGLDVPSLDREDSKTLDAHFAVDAAGMAILEGLVFDDVPPGDYELIALPLKIAGADGSPVRAILRSIP
ncbi:arylformamidase [Kordiimonas gwangyangensis]|uniref:arylformamidase n=1 Tax=Kordiimonas gwangyangensis TaxID=288022 RepID=UPI00036E60ED|nr:arylformamidase [Kordiimonas gwangyangensis]